MAKQMYLEEKIDRILELLEGATVEESEPAPARKGKHEMDEEPDDEPAPPKRGKGKKAKPAAVEHDIDDIRLLATKVGKPEGGREKVVALLKRFGCKQLSQLDSDKYDEFYTQLESINGGDEDPF